MDKGKVFKPKKGKVQPNALPLERAVLGALMLDKEAIMVVLDLLQAESFYSDAHQAIYKAMIRLLHRSQPIDLLTVTEELKNTGELEIAGKPSYLVELTNNVASAANIEYHARLIVQKSAAREVIRFSTKAIARAYDDTTDILDLIGDVTENVGDLVDGFSKKSAVRVADALPKFIKKLEEVSKSEAKGLTGVPTGFTDLDRITAGWQPSDLIILAARPGMGKTALALALAKNAAMDFGKGVAFFSLEMSINQLVGRLVSLEAEISGTKLRTGELEDYEWTQLNVAIEKMGEVPIFIDDTAGINIFELRAKCRRLKMQHDIQMVVVDYLQLMSGGSNFKGNREQEISSISRGLKGLAKELDVPVIALSQLSRAVETRGGMKRPMLSDLRESGSIEQDSDIVGFIYRPEYYQILEDEEGQSLKGIGEVIIAKHRNGALGTIKLKFIDKFAKYTDLDDMGFDDLPVGPPPTAAAKQAADNMSISSFRPATDDLNDIF